MNIQYRTTRMAIQAVAMWEPWDNCWEIILPHITDYKVKLEEGEPMAGVAAEFTRWCRENNLRFQTIGDGEWNDPEGFFYVKGLQRM